jgi:hypothetical protein
VCLGVNLPFLLSSPPTPHTHNTHTHTHTRPQLITTACILLAFKVEEAHQKVRPVINCSRSVWGRGKLAALDQRGPEFRDHRQAVLDAERIILFTLDFDVGVVHPYATIGSTLTLWREAGVFEPAWPRFAKNSAAPREVIATRALAANLAFHLVATEACLLYSPAEIDVAALATAADLVYDQAGGVPSPIRWQHVVTAAGERGACHASELRERIAELLAPLIDGDSAVFIQQHGRVGGVAPTPSLFAELPTEAASSSSLGGSLAMSPQPMSQSDWRVATANAAAAAAVSTNISATTGSSTNMTSVQAADTNLDELPQLE